MSSSKKLAEFPNIEAKLQKPTKKSVFERQREEAEAKRRREEAETAAVLEDFVKSFDRDSDRDNSRDNRFPHSKSDRPLNVSDRPQGFGAGAGKRHFGIQSGLPPPKSGPGSLGPLPTTFGRKRTFDGFSDRGERGEGTVGRARPGVGEHDNSSRKIAKAFDNSEDEAESLASDRAEEKAVSKPTLRLSNLPPGSSQSLIKSLIPASLNVENVKFLPPAGPINTERKSATAIVTLSPETAATEIDAAVSTLQNRYLGFGFYLSLHRHLSSAAISSSLITTQTNSHSSHPFGAKPVSQPKDRSSYRSRGRGFAPPTSYDAQVGSPVNRPGVMHVPVRPPKDIHMLRTIHMVVESILEHGPEFEALLMSRPDVQREEKWAWIWDARSEGGVWYRYRLWEVITGARTQRGKGKFVPLFEGGSAWKLPDQPLSYEYTAGVDEFVSDSEYNSSDDDDFYDEHVGKSGEGGPGAAAAGNEQEENVLSPLEKAKLVHLLARLPTTLSKLRKGDIARVTTFAITHASRGTDEITDLIVSNVEKPFAFSSANPDYKPNQNDRAKDTKSLSPAPDSKAPSEPQDVSTSKLIGLYVISDILSSSSTSGIRHAWRYRQHFEAALRNRKVCEGLGMVPEKMGWGRLRAEKWKRSVGLVLGHWEGWCVFPAESQAFFVDSFENPPALALAQQQKEAKEAEEALSKKNKWKTVPKAIAGEASADNPGPAGNSFVLDDERHLDGEGYLEYTDDEDVDLEVLEGEDIDGEPMITDGMAGLSMEEDGDAKTGGDAELQPPGRSGAEEPQQVTKSVGGFQMSAASVNPKKRMRAMDMFASSDSEEN
ncbi:hypothetical protein MCOR25_002926 [Pyricularia grisea]|uniref:CID domain-containing protein n=1 Tax=Pyricularia grisea TaxID=148305 RepID=A0A6P8B9R9_PYRGI|nr:uncharacterized protein PgNI_04528 [Pyricularia grisea]KAI6375767.1 hypothetical protein MCOR25_002926 [Pyricularia grisea]TLD12551.1 hypothetical protein PgNI_04528 [Pyricularia grisea]